MGEPFDLLVRPNVSPDIRPNPAQLISPSGNPEIGKAIFGGVGTQVIKLTTSVQQSWSRSKPVEIRRQVAVERVYQKEKDGTINKDNYVDVERMKRLETQESNGEKKMHYYADPPMPRDNIEIIRDDEWINNPEAPPGHQEDEQGESGEEGRASP